MKTIEELEKMTVTELLAEMNELHAAANFTPAKFETNEQGSIVLDPTKEEDRLFMED